MKFLIFHLKKIPCKCFSTILSCSCIMILCSVRELENNSQISAILCKIVFILCHFRTTGISHNIPVDCIIAAVLCYYETALLQIHCPFSALHSCRCFTKVNTLFYTFESNVTVFIVRFNFPSCIFKFIHALSQIFTGHIFTR